MQRPIVNPLLLILAIVALVGAAWLYVLGAAVKATEQRASARLKPKERKPPSESRAAGGTLP